MMERLDADAYIKAVKRLEKSSGWKYQSQRFLLNRLTEISALQKEIDSENYQPGLGTEFRINENGHKRLVKAMLPKDAVFQHALANEILVPELRKYLIHDNGASLKGKGIAFTRRRLTQHLCWHYRHYGTDGYVLLIDFRKYFDNIRHDTALKLIARHIHDERILQILKNALKIYEVDISYSDDPDIESKVFSSLEYENIPQELKTGRRIMRKSLGIGSQISQIIGIYYPTLIDTYCKTVKHVHCYDAYMDDRIVIHPSKAFLKALLHDIEAIAKSLGIFINHKKTQIVKLSHGFTWLKTRYILTGTGRIIRKIPRDVIVKQRRKMKKLAGFTKQGEISWHDFERQYKSWRGDKKHYNSYHALRNMDKLFKELKENGRKYENVTVADRHHGTTGKS